MFENTFLLEVEERARYIIGGQDLNNIKYTYYPVLMADTEKSAGTSRQCSKRRNN